MAAEAEHKSLWRARIKSRLELLRPFDSAHVRERLRENLQLIVSQRPGVWGTYHPLPFEADPLIGVLSGVEWAFPRIDGEHLVFHRGEVFQKGRFGLTEPHASNATVEVKELTGILVPGLAFDREGRRLGRGRGYYDRTLVEVSGVTVGVGFSAQLIERVPVDPWDVTLDAIVTEQSVSFGG